MPLFRALAAAASLVPDTGGATVTLLPPLGSAEADWSEPLDWAEPADPADLAESVDPAAAVVSVDSARGAEVVLVARRGAELLAGELSRGGVLPPLWRAVMASTRSLLRILPVPDRPRV